MVKGILEIFSSKLDRNGNTYWAFRFTECKTGRRVVGQAPAESNLTCVFNHKQFRGWAWSEVHVGRTTLGYREFVRKTGDWPYAGCTPDELRGFILDALKGEATS
jgi:hypothetical protein